MNIFSINDYRDEFYVKNLRRWIVVDCLSEDKKFEDGVPLEKAAFVDFLLCNPKVMQRFLVSFGKAQQALNLEDLLYKDNIEFGTAQDTSDFSVTCSLLHAKKYIDVKKTDDGVSLISTKRELPVDSVLIKRWKHEINLLLPVLGKSINVLHNTVLKESNGS